MNQITEFKDITFVIFASIGGIVALLKLWQTFQRQHHDIKRDQLEIITELLRNKPCKHRSFLTAVQREKGVSFILGVDVRSTEIEPLINYYNEGFASLDEITTAWPLRNRETTSLTFRLTAWSKIEMHVARAIGLFLLLLGFLGFVLAALQFVTQWTEAIKTIVQSVFLFGGAFWIVHAIQAEITADSLRKREDENRLPKVREN